jgi:hypothetical protein
MSDYMIALPKTLPGPYTPGKWANIWAAELPVVEKFVRENMDKLQKWQQAAEIPIAQAEVVARVTGPTRTTLLWHNPYGGMKLPHVHYAGDMYVLTESQWTELSKSVMGNIADKLRGAGRVPFDQVMGLSELSAGL